MCAERLPCPLMARALLPTFLSRFLSVNASSAGATCQHRVHHFVMTIHHVGSRYDYTSCGLSAKLPFSHAHLQAARTSHLHIRASGCTCFHGDASESSQGLQNLSLAVLQPLNSIRLPHSEDAVQNACGAHEVEDRGTRSQAAPQRRARCKGKKRPELLRRKVPVLESCEHVPPAHATVLKLVLKEFLGSNEKACQALTASPGILYQRSELLGQKLTVLAHFGIREDVFRKLCTTPRVLSRKLESLHQTLSLLEEIGLSAKARNNIFRAYPRIARASGIAMLRTLDFFKSLGMDGKEMSQSLDRQPSLLLSSVYNLIERYSFFRQLGFTDNEFIKVTCAGLPALAIGTFQAKIKFLKDQGFSDSDVHVLISQQPSLLGLRCNRLKSKLDFLLCKQNYDIADIVRCPTCLSFSLQDRLIPRLTTVRERGLFKVYALSTILNCREMVFQKLGSRRRG